MFDLKPCLGPKKPCSATLLKKQKRPFSNRMTRWPSLLIFPLEIKHWRLEDSWIFFLDWGINLLCVYDAGDRRKTIRSLSQQSVERSDLRHIKTNLDTLLSDEEYENNLHNHAVPSEPNQHRSSEPIKRQKSAIRHKAFCVFGAWAPAENAQVFFITAELCSA